MPTPINSGAAVWELPPLILHPFNERVPPSQLLENSKAALVLSGLLPDEGDDHAELLRRLLAGRYSEVRMLFFLGRDVFRWIEQCMEWSRRSPSPGNPDLAPQSFARLLAEQPPEKVREKLLRWGVCDHASIFSRAIGLNVLFCEVPTFNGLAEEFLRNYHRYADSVFSSYLESQSHCRIGADLFQFELYASGEYSHKLESEWDVS